MEGADRSVLERVAQDHEDFVAVAQPSLKPSPPPRPQTQNPLYSAKRPSDSLEEEVEGLADRFALVDPELLSANKRIVNVGMELMGDLRRYRPCQIRR